MPQPHPVSGKAQAKQTAGPPLATLPLIHRRLAPSRSQRTPNREGEAPAEPISSPNPNPRTARLEPRPPKRCPPTETLASAWQRLSDHFEVLLDHPSGPAHLRQSILQLAVQGKLVPQDPTDEPASEMLEGITARRSELMTEGKINKVKKLP